MDNEMLNVTEPDLTNGDVPANIALQPVNGDLQNKPEENASTSRRRKGGLPTINMSLLVPPKPARTEPLEWVCTCSEYNHNCARSKMLDKYVLGQDKIVAWMAGKHLAVLTPEDYLPAYLLIRLKGGEVARAVFRDMFADCQQPAKWILNPHWLLQLIANTLKIPWNVNHEKFPKQRTGELPADFLHRKKLHFKTIVNCLLQHYFVWFNVMPSPESTLRQLASTMYRDLLNMNGRLSYKDYFYPFSPEWLVEFLAKNQIYRSKVLIPPQLETDSETPIETSITNLVHFMKPVEFIPAERESTNDAEVPVEADTTTTSTSSSAVAIDDAPQPTPEEISSAASTSRGANSKKRRDELQAKVLRERAAAEAKRLEEEKKVQALIEQSWQDLYISDYLYDPFENGGDICDCLASDCAGCHSTCLNCGTRKCGVLCRQLKVFHFGDLVANERPEYYHWHSISRRREEEEKKRIEEAQAEKEKELTLRRATEERIHRQFCRPEEAREDAPPAEAPLQRPATSSRGRGRGSKRGRGAKRGQKRKTAGSRSRPVSESSSMDAQV